jgi:hypothetical protein
MLASALVLYVSRDALELKQTFPELAKIPLVGKLLT